MDRRTKTKIAQYRVGLIVKILGGIWEKYRGQVIWGLWHKHGGRFYFEVDIRGDLATAQKIVEDLLNELSAHGVWVRQLGPIKSVVKKSGEKVWRLSARARVFSVPQQIGP